MKLLKRAFGTEDRPAGELSRLILNFIWFLFIAIFVGQLGPILVIANDVWNGVCVFDALDQRAGKGDFILCSTAILAGATYFIVKEYNSIYELKPGREKKSLVVLLAIFFCFWGVLLAATLLMQQEFTNLFQRSVHWFVYSLSILLSFALWLIEYAGGDAQEVIRKIADSSMEITSKSAAENVGDVAL